MNLKENCKVGTLKRAVREEQEDKIASVPLCYSIVSLVFLVEKARAADTPR